MGGETFRHRHVRPVIEGHPRVGGGNLSGAPISNRRRRSIPAWAGNRCTIGKNPGQVGSIPAWAGKPSTRRPDSGSMRVHPRVGGEPSRNADMARTAAVHPRVGGETIAATLFPRSTIGPSPRGRGNLRPCTSTTLKGGPSPRGPGNRFRFEVEDLVRWSIPAWAGKPVGPAQPHAWRRVHPRVGGETHATAGRRDELRGPSPRGRGNREVGGVIGSGGGSIPAWAGKPWVGQP